ncbi:Ig-like domain-containing protein [Terrisporobacter glycolicus]|uniref:Ig-like domain-containing protein n=1 Tax=Terrisporobacter glycolicus TaxID=36841 RepID=UPI0034641AD5
MNKKLLSLLLSFMMIVSITASSFADGVSNVIPRSASIEDILGDILLDENAEVESKRSTIKLDAEKKYKVNADLSLIMYKFKLASDKSINLSYKSTSKLFEVTMVGSDEESIIWSDTMVNESKEVSNNVNLKLKKGEYAILVTATKGNYTISPKTTKTLKNMSPFTVKKVLPGTTSLSGTGVAGAKVSVMTDSYKTYTTTVKSDNTYKLTIPKQEEYSTLIVKIEKSGYGSKLALVEAEYAKFSTFTVNQLKSTSTKISGKGKSGATVRAYVDGKKIGETIVKSDGTYSMKIKKQSSGRKILVKMYKTGYTTKSKTITVKKVFSKGLTVNSVKSTQKTITGKGSKGATVKAYVNNKQIGKATVKSNGTYSMKIKKQSKGKSITVKMSKSGYAISSKSIKIK